MKRLAFGRNLFFSITKVTGSREALDSLAAAAESGNIERFQRELDPSGESLQVGLGTSSCFDFRASKLTLSREDLAILAGALKELVEAPQRAEKGLQALGILPPRYFRDNVVFRKQDSAPTLHRDYSTDGAGSGTWEGVLYHPKADLKQYKRLREALLEWCLPTPDEVEKSIAAIDAEGERQDVGLEEAHRRLRDEEGSTFLWLDFDHPLTVRFGSSKTEGKLWLYDDMAEFILPAWVMWSGDFQVDVENFLSYRKILMDFAQILDATRFAWGDTADAVPMEKTRPVSHFRDPNAMWEVLLENYLDILTPEQIPPSVKERFLQAAHWSTYPDFS